MGHLIPQISNEGVSFQHNLKLLVELGECYRTTFEPDETQLFQSLHMNHEGE